MMPQEKEPMTFDDLTSAYRSEIKKPLLTEVRKDFYRAMDGLRETLKKDYDRECSKDPDSIICEGLNERRKKAAVHMQKVTDLRMEKVVTMALRASMGADIGIENLTPEERAFYDGVLSESKNHRSALIKEKRNYRIPDISPDAAENKTDDGAGPVPAYGDVDTDEPASVFEGEEYLEEPCAAGAEEEEEMLTIRVLEDLPKIAGPDCDYELRKEDVVRMPAALANALINHEKAVLLKVTP